jgi:hypothetical protein
MSVIQRKERRMNKLLLDEHPLQVLPSLACTIGLNEAIVLQQIHYWLKAYEHKHIGDHFKDGRWWVYNSYEQWKTDNFPFFSVATIKRTVLKLEEIHLLVSSSKYNQKSSDRTKWYSIDYDKLDLLSADSSISTSEQSSYQIEPTIVSNCDDASYQIEPLYNTETTIRLTTDINTADIESSNSVDKPETNTKNVTKEPSSTKKPRFPSNIENHPLLEELETESQRTMFKRMLSKEIPTEYM